MLVSKEFFFDFVFNRNMVFTAKAKSRFLKKFPLKKLDCKFIDIFVQFLVAETFLLWNFYMAHSVYEWNISNNFYVIIRTKVYSFFSINIILIVFKRILSFVISFFETKPFSRFFIINGLPNAIDLEVIKLTTLFIKKLGSFYYLRWLPGTFTNRLILMDYWYNKHYLLLKNNIVVGWRSEVRKKAIKMNFFPDLIIGLSSYGIYDLMLREAHKFHIPVISIIDSNSSERMVSYPLRGNDDSYKSLSLYVFILRKAIDRGKHLSFFFKNEISLKKNKYNKKKKKLFNLFKSFTGDLFLKKFESFDCKNKFKIQKRMLVYGSTYLFFVFNTLFYEFFFLKNKFKFSNFKNFFLFKKFTGYFKFFFKNTKYRFFYKKLLKINSKFKNYSKKKFIKILFSSFFKIFKIKENKFFIKLRNIFKVFYTKIISKIKSFLKFSKLFSFIRLFSGRVYSRVRRKFLRDKDSEFFGGIMSKLSKKVSKIFFFSALSRLRPKKNILIIRVAKRMFSRYRYKDYVGHSFNIRRSWGFYSYLFFVFKWDFKVKGFKGFNSLFLNRLKIFFLNRYNFLFKKNILKYSSFFLSAKKKYFRVL